MILTNQTPSLKKRSALRKAKHYIAFGYARKDIIEMLVRDYQYTEDTATHTYQTAAKEMVEDMKEYDKMIAIKNRKRLNAISEAAFDSGDFKSAVKAIDVENKMNGIYTTKVEIENADSDFVVKIANE